MDSIIPLGGREHSTIKETPEVLGKETISMYIESRIRDQSESYGQNLQRLGKELMTMDELTTMLGNKCTLQFRGLCPLFSPKCDLKKHPNYKHMVEADKKCNVLHLEELISTRLELNPNEEYGVYEAGDADSPDDDILNHDDLDNLDASV